MLAIYNVSEWGNNELSAAITMNNNVKIYWVLKIQ